MTCLLKQRLLIQIVSTVVALLQSNIYTHPTSDFFAYDTCMAPKLVTTVGVFANMTTLAFAKAFNDSIPYAASPRHCFRSAHL